MFYSGRAHYVLDPADRSSNSYYSDTRGLVRLSGDTLGNFKRRGQTKNAQIGALFERVES